jgi:hypothetical protein
MPESKKASSFFLLLFGFVVGAFRLELLLWKQQRKDQA